VSNPLILFVKLPKTGGSSVYRHLSSNLNCQDLYRSSPPYSINENTSAILQWGDHLIELFSSEKDKDKLQSSRRFATVRCPYSKCLSAYNYIRGTLKSSFFVENTIENCLKQRPEFIEGDPLSTNHDWLHFSLSQTELMYSERPQANNMYGRLIDDSKYDFSPHELTILKQENLNEEFSSFLRPLGFSLKDLPTENRSKYIQNNLSKEAVDLINNIYHDDFVNFNYEKIDGSFYNI